MTALCGGGPSQQQPGVPYAIAYSATELGLLLSRLGWAPLIPIIGALGVVPILVQDLCSTDPPGFEVMTAAEVYDALLNQNLSEHVFAAKTKLSNNIKTQLWYELCQCSAVATPARPAPPALPNNLPVGPALPSSTPCATHTRAAQSFAGGIQFDDTQVLMWPLNATFVRATFHHTLSGAGNHPDAFGRLYFTDHNGAALGQPYYSQAIPPGGTATIDRATFEGAGGAFGVASTSGQITSTDIMDWTIDVYCDGQFPGVTPHACPTDPAVLLQLQQILDLVTLIQRQKVPFAYVPGALHSGLSGTGQMAIAGLIGLSAHLTSLPAAIGRIGGTPDELFEVGWLTLGTADGWHRSIRLDHNPTLVMPIDASDQLVGWTLEPGVVLELLELVREP